MINNAYKFFPIIEDKFKDKLRIDEVGMYSISTPKKADIISRIILDCLQKRIPANKVVITDAMAGVGGNVISFARHFAHVNATEIDPQRFLYLINNINVFKCHNVTTININYMEVFSHVKQDVIFLDPPWGGKQYKEQEHTDIIIGDIQLEEFCKRIAQNNLCRLIVLKLPTNFNLEKLSGFRKVKVYDLKKMLVVLIYCNR